MSLSDHRFLKGFRGKIAGHRLLQDEDVQVEINSKYNYVTGIVKDVISNPYEYLNRSFPETNYTFKEVLSGVVKPEISFNGEPPSQYDFSADIENAPLIESMPINSIFAYIVDNKKSRDTGRYVICYPFFPPHMSLPLKPGEYVWIITEKIGALTYYYWLCRKVGPLQLDDVNLTNYERLPYVNQLIDFSRNNNTSNLDLDNVYSLNELTDRYQNKIKGSAESGTNFPEPMSLIFKHSYAYNKEFTGEPVPRVAKDCGDLLLQGSNNAGIHLTTEKFLDVSSQFSPYNLGNNNNVNLKADAAAIDLFVGRKKNSKNQVRYAGKSFFFDEKRGVNGKMNFAANNSFDSNLEFIENDKVADLRTGDPEIYNEELNDSAGDAMDVAARLYLSHNSSPDFLFGSAFDVLSARAGESIVTYADHNRVVGNVDTRIVSRAGQSFIDLDPLGNIVMKSSIDNGQQFLSLINNGVTRLQARDKLELAVRSNNESPEEPYILYSELKTILDKIMSNLLILNNLYIDNMGSTLAKASQASIAASAAAVAAGNPVGSPTHDEAVNTGVAVALGADLFDAIAGAVSATGETKIEDSDASRTGESKSSPAPLGSTKIFGE